jgi:hypothetical protein
MFCEMMTQCGWLVPILLFIILELLILVWIEFRYLRKWKKWAGKYRDWVGLNCDCGSPTTPPPEEPDWP